MSVKRLSSSAPPVKRKAVNLEVKLTMLRRLDQDGRVIDIANSMDLADSAVCTITKGKDKSSSSG